MSWLGAQQDTFGSSALGAENFIFLVKEDTARAKHINVLSNRCSGMGQSAWSSKWPDMAGAMTDVGVSKRRLAAALHSSHLNC